MSSNGLLQILKQVTNNSLEADKPTDIVMGEVISVSPLQIKVNQQETLPADFFMLTKAVLDHYVDIEVNHVTENRAGGGGDAAYASHNHDYIGRKKIMIYNGLKVGEKVILLRRRGGQEYIVLDRVFEHQVNGEWL